MKIKTNGIELNCVIEGEGPWVTMSHSLACNLSMWDEQAKLLVSKGYKVLRFDTRGHGASDAPDVTYTLEQMADDLHGLYAALGIKHSHWIGLSMGGMIGETYALKYPGVFTSMILADTTSRRPPNAEQMWGDRVKIARAQGMDALVEGTLSRWFTEPFLKAQPAVKARIGNDIRTTPVAGYAGSCEAIAKIVPGWEKIGDIDLVIAATGTPDVNADQLRPTTVPCPGFESPSLQERSSPGTDQSLQLSYDPVGL